MTFVYSDPPISLLVSPIRMMNSSDDLKLLFTAWSTSSNNPATKIIPNATIEVVYSEMSESEARAKVHTFVKPFEAKPFFGNPYWPLKRFPFKTKVYKNRIEFIQTVKGPRSWGYRYEKSLTLAPDKPVILVKHKLTNTGKKRIQTSQYSHNFILIDDDPVANNYSVRFNFKVILKKNIRKGAKRKGNKLILNGKTIFSELTGYRSLKHNFADVRHIPSGRGIIVSGDFAPADYRIFTNKRAVCPEIFKWIDIAPGESCEWTRKYKLY